MVSTTSSYDIRVKVANKIEETYSYSNGDTVQHLKEKIFQFEGVPVEQQSLYIRYGWGKCCALKEITDSSELLTKLLKTASKVEVYVSLNKDK